METFSLEQEHYSLQFFANILDQRIDYQSLS